ncbi:hypothetical protein LJK87_08180 [Paenibacillus sp. P25]|nr:hypothetical protein LJK87_08180 [Paenibacillus sp. P25]
MQSRNVLLRMTTFLTAPDSYQLFASPDILIPAPGALITLCSTSTLPGVVISDPLARFERNVQ